MIQRSKSSPLSVEVCTLFENLSNANGMIYHIHSQLKGYNSNYKKGAQGNSTYNILPILSTILYITDISEPNTSSRKVVWDFGYKLYLEDIDSRFEILTSRMSMRELSYCYDIFETFLKDITANFLLLNHKNYADEIKLLFKKEMRGNEKYDAYLNTEIQRKKLHTLTGSGNKELFKLIRRICPELKAIEKTNYIGLDLLEWYQVFTSVRHSIIHSNSVIKRSMYETGKMSKLQISYLKQYFMAQERVEGMVLCMTPQNVRDHIELLANYGLQIFKHFCLAGGYEWEIFGELE